MSNIDKIADWDKYEEGADEAKKYVNNGSDVLFGIRRAIDNYAEDELLSKPGQLSYKSGYLDVVIQALKDESERVKNDIMTFYVEGELEDNGRESDNYIGTAGNIGHDGCSTDPRREAGDI